MKYLEVVADDGRSATSYGTATSTSASNSSPTVDPIAQSATLSELVISVVSSLGGKFQIDKQLASSQMTKSQYSFLMTRALKTMEDMTSADYGELW